MASYTWPATLPQCVNADGYSETKVSNVIRTPMDAGVSKTRHRGRRPQTLSVSFDMTNDQLDALEDFLTLINYVYRFDFPHPRTTTVVEVRIVPQSNGEMYTVSPIMSGANKWKVNMSLEIMP